jgi:hypothetical protein
MYHDNVLDCLQIVNAAIRQADESGWSRPRRFAAYIKAWQRAYDQSGGFYDRATPRLICLTSRLADILS